VVSADNRELRFIGEDEVTISQDAPSFREVLGVLRDTPNEDPESFIKKFEGKGKLKKLARQEEAEKEVGSFWP
jgi:hypothetical protein